MNNTSYQVLQEKFPFLTIVSYLGTEYIGIIQNADNSFISIYVLELNSPSIIKQEFLQCGEVWWWESNRNTPINLFLGERFKPFKKWLKTFSKKEAKIVIGPTINMLDLINRRLKKRTIQLVKNM